MNTVEIVQGDGPILLGLPHTGTYVPREIRSRLNDLGRDLADTDWNVHKLYDGLLDGVTTVRATAHRYVIDVNRDPAGHSLYPGQNTTGLVPLTDFDGQTIWHRPPADDEIAQRREMFHAPYHAALTAEMTRIQKRHGIALLYDCHSIRSHIPYLFDGTLPDFNIGTNDGASCAPAVAQAVEAICTGAQGFSSVSNGRFKGGWTTRHYGRPDEGWHAIQMELAQGTYMQEAAPWPYLHHRADRLRPYLARILETLDHLARSGDLT